MIRFLSALGWVRKGVPASRTSGRFGYGAWLYGVTPYGDE